MAPDFITPDVSESRSLLRLPTRRSRLRLPLHPLRPSVRDNKYWESPSDMLQSAYDNTIITQKQCHHWF